LSDVFKILNDQTIVTLNWFRFYQQP